MIQIKLRRQYLHRIFNILLSLLKYIKSSSEWQWYAHSCVSLYFCQLVDYFTCSRERERKRKNDDDKHWYYAINKLTKQRIVRSWAAVAGVIVQFFGRPSFCISLSLSPSWFHSFALFVYEFFVARLLVSELNRRYNHFGCPQQICFAFCDISIFYAANGLKYVVCSIPFRSRVGSVNIKLFIICLQTRTRSEVLSGQC